MVDDGALVSKHVADMRQACVQILCIWLVQKRRLVELCCRTFGHHHLLFGFETVNSFWVRKKLIMAGEIAAAERMGNPSLGFSGYQCGIDGLNWKLISWARVKENAASAKGS